MGGRGGNGKSRRGKTDEEIAAAIAEQVSTPATPPDQPEQDRPQPTPPESAPPERPAPMVTADGAGSVDLWKQNLAPGISDPDVLAREAERMAEWDQRVRQAYEKVASRPGDWARLADLRAELSAELGEVDHADLSEALLTLSGKGIGAMVAPESDTRAITQADRDAAVHVGDQAKHLIAIQPREEPYWFDVPGRDRDPAQAPITVISQYPYDKPSTMAAYPDQLEPVLAHLKEHGATILGIEGQPDTEPGPAGP